MFENDTKRKVTKREYNKWIKWLRAQGFSGPFAGLTTSNECVKLLYKELRKVPPTILETRPRDKRTISSNLTKYGRRRNKGLAEDSYSHKDIAKYWKPGQRHLEHWVRLVKVAEELSIGLDFPVLKTYSIRDSRFGGKVTGQWFYHPSKNQQCHFPQNSLNYGITSSSIWITSLKRLVRDLKNLNELQKE